MEEHDIEQRFRLLQKQVEATASLLNDIKIDLTAAIDSVKLEIETIKMFIERHHPEFSDEYAKLKEEATQAIDPEWMKTGTGKKT